MKRRHRKTRAMVRVRTRTIHKTRYRTRRRHGRRRRGGRGGGGVNLMHLGVAAVGLGLLNAQRAPQVDAFVQKLPGQKTFGTPATIGLYALGVNHFVKRNKWLKLLGIAGLVLAAVKVGDQGAGFRFVGDDDLGDDDLGDDDMGDADDGMVSDVGDDD